MKRNGFLAGLCMLLSLFILSGCQPAADTNPAAAPNSNSGKETVDTAAIQAELLRIENDWPRVVKERDVAAIRRVEADDAVFVYPDGSTGDKATDIKDMETGALTADSFEMLDLKVNVISGDAAIVSGRSVVTNGKYKMPDGKSMDISGQYHFIDTFARRNGEWKLVAGASTRIMAPTPTASPAASGSPASKASPATAASPAANMAPAKNTPITAPAKNTPVTAASPTMKSTP